MSHPLEIDVDSLFDGKRFVGNEELFPEIRVLVNEEQSSPKHPWVTHFEFQGQMMPVKGFVWNKPYKEVFSIFYVEAYGTPMLMILYDPANESWRLLGLMP